MYMDYEADDVRARGQITETSALVASADAVAYGARVTTANGSIGIDGPFPFRFQGRVNGIDLRRVPATVPVPRVESLLTFDYDIAGRFSDPFIIGGATFARSQFLGATVGAGTVGSIDTLQKPLRFTGDGDIDNVNLRVFGEGLEVEWLQEPRYAGIVSGHFQVTGTGTDPNTDADGRWTPDTRGTVQRHAVGRGRVDRSRPRDAAARRSTGGSPRSIPRCRSWIPG